MDSSYNYSTNYSSAQPLSPVVAIIYLAVVVLIIAAMWKVFTKAGKPGWAALVPIYNVYVMLQIIGRPTWWLVLYLVPIANVIVSIIVIFDMAKSFGKSTGFGFGLLFLSPIFYPILAFGDAKYVGPSAGGVAPTAPVGPAAPAAQAPPTPPTTPAK